jgi:hypothetical protein
MPYRVLTSFQQRAGPALAPYPHVTQGMEPLCVFASVAAAINHLAQSNVSAIELKTALGLQQPTFDNVVRLALARIPPQQCPVAPTKFHARDNPLADFNRVRTALVQGGILILSLEVACFNTRPPCQRDTPCRCQRWHMLSVFGVRRHDNDDLIQVWDTNDSAGWLAMSDIEGFLTAQEMVLPYIALPDCLVGHDQRECLLWTPP